MEIIKCTEADIKEIAEFYDSVVVKLESGVNYPKWERGVYPCEASVRSAIAEGTQYKCTDGKNVLGAFILNSDPQGDYSRGQWSADLRDGEYLVIHTLATAPDAVKRGIAKEMVRYSINAARSRGFKAMRLDVVPDNIPARRLYESMGFEFAGDADLSREVDIPIFSLYELNFKM